MIILKGCSQGGNKLVSSSSKSAINAVSQVNMQNFKSITAEGIYAKFGPGSQPLSPEKSGRGGPASIHSGHTPVKPVAPFNIPRK
jgi:hypothetical protein